MVFTLSSIAIETAVLFVIYRVIFYTLLKHGLRKLFSSRPWWDYLLTYEGVYNKNAQVELVFVSLLTIHHFIAGFMLLFGIIYDNPILIGHAFIWELVHEINDMICMICLFWPFHERNLKMIFIVGVHHLAGIIIIVPVLTSNLYLDRHLQVAGLSLLLAGAVQCFLLAVSRTIDRRIASEAWMDACLWVLAGFIFSVCRYYVFPLELYLFFENGNFQASMSMKYALCAAVLLMTLSNILISIKGTNAFVTTISIALNNGVKHDFDLSCRCNGCHNNRKDKLKQQ